jgi:glutamate/aspartate transport system substrate-binding protein
VKSSGQSFLSQKGGTEHRAAIKANITQALFARQSPVSATILHRAMGNAFTVKNALWVATGFCLVALCFKVRAADDLTGTLKKIKDAGSISVGHRESSIPFSYYDDQNQVVGYSEDLVTMVIDAVKQKLEMPNLQVRMTPVTSQNRIPLVQNGTIDIEAGSTTNNLERQQQVAFSNTMFIIGTRLLVKKDSGIQDFPDLKGKNVVVTAGTTSERLIRELNQKQDMKMNIISAKDHGESFLTLQSGRAVAFMLDDALLAGERAKAKRPDDWVIVGTPQSKEAYGMMIPKGDDQFKALVDEAIAKAETSGEAAKLYQKWFLSPIPPKGLNLNLPLSDDMKALFSSPNDKAYQ